jgi:hypothetical protein
MAIIAISMLRCKRVRRQHINQPQRSNLIGSILKVPVVERDLGAIIKTLRRQCFCTKRIRNHPVDHQLQINVVIWQADKIFD